MRVLRVHRGKVGAKALAEALAVLEAGGVVAFPTETAYGLAADPRQQRAVRRIYKMKGRERGKPLPLVAASAAQVRRLARMGSRSRRLAERHWPGPLTLVLDAKAAAGIVGLGPGRTLAVRVPGSSWARALPEALGAPVTSTSANVSGTAPLYSGAAVRRAFASRKDAPDLLIDAGRLPVRPPSTIVRLEGGKMKVLREGPIKIESGK